MLFDSLIIVKNTSFIWPKNPQMLMQKKMYTVFYRQNHEFPNYMHKKVLQILINFTHFHLSAHCGQFRNMSSQARNMSGQARNKSGQDRNMSSQVRNMSGTYQVKSPTCQVKSGTCQVKSGSC